MKNIEINGKDYTLSFGIDFIREMDKRYHIDAEGFPLGAGLQSAIIYLIQENPVIIEEKRMNEILGKTNNKPVSQDLIERAKRIQKMRKEGN